MTPTTDDYIKAAMHAFTAERSEKVVHAGGRTMRVHGPGERILHLPNGRTVKVTVDDSGTATQIWEDEKLHAIVRPDPVRLRLMMRNPATAVSASATPETVQAHTAVLES